MGGGGGAVVGGELVERLRARRGELEAAIFARVRESAFGERGRGDFEYLVGLRGAVGAALDYALLGLERGSATGVPVPVDALVQARRAARVGVGLDTVLRRYLAGHALLKDCLLVEAERGGFSAVSADGPGSLRGVLARQAWLLDRLIALVASAYGEEIELGAGGSARTEPRGGGGGALPGSVAEGGAEGGAGSRRERAFRRDRILRALVGVLAERGFAGVTVGLVLARAGVSRHTFYEEFDGVEDALVAVMDGTLEQVLALASRELAAAERWQDGVLWALAAVLSFFDSEPELARVCIVETLAGGPVVLEHREGVIAAFRAAVIERIEREEPGVSPLVAQGAMGSVLEIMHAHIVAQRTGPFVELLGPLVGLVMAPYLSAREAQAEVERGAALARELGAGRSSMLPSTAGGMGSHPISHPPVDAGPGAGQSAGAAAVPGALEDARAYRMRLCLLYVAAQGGRGSYPSNQEVGDGVGVSHSGQVARLLSRLADLGLLAKRAGAPGHPNAWSATPAGEGVARALTGGERRALGAITSSQNTTPTGEWPEQDERPADNTPADEQPE